MKELSTLVACPFSDGFILLPTSGPKFLPSCLPNSQSFQNNSIAWGRFNFSERQNINYPTTIELNSQKYRR